MIKFVKYLYNTIVSEFKLYKILSSKEYENRRLEGEIIRNTHSIEKGLSLESVRLGFGYKKMKYAFGCIDRYVKNGGDINIIPIKMYAGAVSAYLKFHKERSYIDDHIKEISKMSYSLNNKITNKGIDFGGYMDISHCNYDQIEQDVIRKLFENRHSVREFAGTPVDEKDLTQAINMACHCPSACNRQCYRVYIVDHKDFSKLKGWMDGVGGFADELDKILIVTGNLSVYRSGERYQFVVTGSVFASYLTLSLEAMNIGCCFIQRPLTPNKSWSKISTILEVSGDEQVVCALGIGNFKDKYKVPVSYRFPATSITRYI